jgi:transposase-like protein
MAKIDKVLCPFCIFTSKYIDLIINDEGQYVCPNCNSAFSYEELMQLYSLSQYSGNIKKENLKRFS